MRKIFKKYKLQFIFSSIFFILIVPFIINLSFKFSIFPIFIAEWSAGDVLQYYGLILTASGTLFISVAALISSESANERIMAYEKENTRKPFFLIEGIELNVSDENKGNFIISQSENNKDIFFIKTTKSNTSILGSIINIKLKNVGEGAAYNFDCGLTNTAIAVGRNEYFDVQICYDSNSKYFFDCSIIYSNGSGCTYEQKIKFNWIMYEDDYDSDKSIQILFIQLMDKQEVKNIT